MTSGSDMLIILIELMTPLVKLSHFKYIRFTVCQSYLYKAIKNTVELFHGSISINMKYEDGKNFIVFMCVCT